MDDLPALALQLAIVEFENEDLLHWLIGWSSRSARPVLLWTSDDEKLIALLPFPGLLCVFVADRVNLQEIAVDIGKSDQTGQKGLDLSDVVNFQRSGNMRRSVDDTKEGGDG